MGTVLTDKHTGAATATADIFPRDFTVYLNRVAEAEAARAEAGGIVRANAQPAHSNEIRRSNVTWLQDTPDNRPIIQLIFDAAREFNQKIFHLELSGLTEPFQLATYKATEQGFYGWHMDIGAGWLANRKLSLVVPLTDPSEYEGGEFQVFHDHEPLTLEMPLGRVLAFPSYLLHRVTPVTKGVRRSLAIWVSGPPFR
jgi:PKHD-type hydroxylase